MEITAARLIALGVKPMTAMTFGPLLNTACRDGGIDTRERVASFLSNALHESTMLSRLEEELRYSTPERICEMWRFVTLAEAKTLVRNPYKLAVRVYSNRLGNGPPETGDGFTYRGRGIFMLTGRRNYRAAGEALRQPYEAKPDLVAAPFDAVRTAVWFWNANGCNNDADTGDQDAVCGKVNGPKRAGLKERKALYARAVQVLA